MAIDCSVIDDKVGTDAFKRTQKFSQFYLFFFFMEVVYFNAFEAISEKYVEDIVLMLFVVLFLQQKFDAGLRLLHDCEPLL